MFVKGNLVLLLDICLLYTVVMNGYEVVLVSRNVPSSFRVGKDGCTTCTMVV